MAGQKDIILKKAQEFSARGDIQKAILEWKKLVVEAPQDGGVHNSIADLYLRINDRAHAIESCLKAAALYREAGFELKGVALLKKILKIDPNRIDIHEKLADINAERGLTGSAIDAYHQTAKLYARLGNFKAAIAVYQKLVRFTPDDPEIPLSIARLYHKQEQHKDAVLFYGQAEALYGSKNMAAEARHIVEEIMKLDPNYLKNLAKREAAMAALETPRDISIPPPPPSPPPLPSSQDGGDPFWTPPQVPVEEMERVPLYEEETGVFRGVAPEMPYEEPPVFPLLPPMTKGKGALLTQGGTPDVSEVIFQAHLAEVEIYLRYGLNQNAIEKLILAKELVPTREEPYLQLKEVYLKEGQKDKAAQVGWALASLYEQKREFDKKAALLRELQNIDPENEYQKQRGKGAETPLSRKEVWPGPEGGTVPVFPEWSSAAGEAIASLPSRVAANESVNAVKEPPFEGISGMGSGSFEFPPIEDTIDKPQVQPVSSPLERPIFEKGEGESTDQEGYFDLASAMTEELGGVSRESLAVVPEGGEPILSVQESSVHEEKRRQYLESCFHLGIAHKEVGNLEKAVRELENALVGIGGDRFREVVTLLASCYVEQGNSGQAMEVLKRGINDSRSQGGTGGGRLTIQYDLASIYEQSGEGEKAFSVYQEIYRVDPKFKDVSGKVKEYSAFYRRPALQPQQPTGPTLPVLERAGVREKTVVGLSSVETKLKAVPVREKRRVSYV